MLITQNSDAIRYISLHIIDTIKMEFPEPSYYNEEHVNLIMDQTSCTREVAINAYIKTACDVVNAIMSIM